MNDFVKKIAMEVNINKTKITVFASQRKYDRMRYMYWRLMKSARNVALVLDAVGPISPEVRISAALWAIFAS
ncbi:hypothetical protein EVAR_25925_1 [Eumeta japonica]|uniref:Uncharacterized protein n=1 Tax=Eumeta variegata TaxID=151549 RepID=A0A4C1W3Z9_EUMVA|nr:hypothetical protein EVAR_25925_1 [Eumeta japonica]